MSVPIEGDGFLGELEIEVREELTLTASSDVEEAAEQPVSEWLYDPVDAERERTGLQGLLGAVRELEDESRPGGVRD